jgi:hypothetical protein
LAARAVKTNEGEIFASMNLILRAWERCGIRKK